MDKQSFYKSINPNTIFDNEFCKRVYSYSISDNLFLPAVVSILVSINREDVIRVYNEWFSEWKREDDKMMKEVSIWYQKECDMQYNRWIKEHPGRTVKNWSLQAMSNQDLLILLENLTKEV